MSQDLSKITNSLANYDEDVEEDIQINNNVNYNRDIYASKATNKNNTALNIKCRSAKNFNTLKSNFEFDEDRIITDNGEVFFESEIDFNNANEEFETPLNKKIQIIDIDDLINKTEIKTNFYDPLYEVKRNKLPLKRQNVTFNVWNFLKGVLGKDLTRVTVPGKYI